MDLPIPPKASYSVRELGIVGVALTAERLTAGIILDGAMSIPSLRAASSAKDRSNIATHLDLASAVKNAVALAGISLDDALRAASLVRRA